MGTSLFEPSNVLADVPYRIFWNHTGSINYSEDGVIVTFKFRLLDETVAKQHGNTRP